MTGGINIHSPAGVPRELCRVLTYRQMFVFRELSTQSPSTNSCCWHQHYFENIFLHNIIYKFTLLRSLKSFQSNLLPWKDALARFTFTLFLASSNHVSGQINSWATSCQNVYTYIYIHIYMYTIFENCLPFRSNVSKAIRHQPYVHGLYFPMCGLAIGMVCRRPWPRHPSWWNSFQQRCEPPPPHGPIELGDWLWFYLPEKREFHKKKHAIELEISARKIGILWDFTSLPKLGVESIKNGDWSDTRWGQWGLNQSGISSAVSVLILWSSEILGMYCSSCWISIQRMGQNFPTKLGRNQGLRVGSSWWLLRWPMPSSVEPC